MAKIILKEKLNKLSLKLGGVLKSDFLYDRAVILNLTLALLLNLFIFVIFVLKIKPQEALLPINYNTYVGASRLGKWYQIYEIPFFGLAIIVLNSFLAYFLYEKERLISFFLVSGAFIIQIFLLFQALAFVRFIGD